MSKQGRTNRHIEFFLGTLIFVPIMLALVVVSYYEVNYFGLLIFKGLDGHCELGYQSLGNHCFGDYWAIDFTGFMSPLKPAEGVYLPFARIATAPVKIIIMIFGNQTGIVLSAVLAMVLVIAGVLNRRLTQLDPIEILFISSSIPVLAIYDRLNTVWLAFLFLTFAFKAQTARRSITFLSLAILIKPGLIVFAYPILIELFEKTEPKRSIKYILQGVSFPLFSAIIFLFLFHSETGWSFQFWFNEVRSWTEREQGSIYPFDLSPYRYFGIGPVAVISLLVMILFHLIVAVKSSLQRSDSMSKYHVGAPYTEAMLVSFSLLLLMQRPFWSYNLIFLIPPFVECSRRLKCRSNSSSIERKYLTPIYVVSALILAPIALPSRFTVGDVFVTGFNKDEILFNLYDYYLRGPLLFGLVLIVLITAAFRMFQYIPSTRK